jgi:hypothetical protein
MAAATTTPKDGFVGQPIVASANLMRAFAAQEPLRTPLARFLSPA